MSLSTLLEAARFLELQEQHRATVEAALAASKPLATNPIPLLTQAPPPTQQTITAVTPSKPPITVTATPHQTVVISSSNISPAIIQGPITLATPVIKKPDVQVTSTIPTHPKHRVLHNSFDIMNPLVIDETNEGKRRQPPLVFRAGTREVHNKLEKHRRAHLKECFDILKKQLPSTQDEKKTSNLSILHSALRYIQTLKRRERELEHEMERLAREKISAQQRLAVLKKDISAHYDNVDFSKILPEIVSSTTQGSLSSNDVVVDSECKIESMTMTTSSGQQNGGGTERIAIPVLTKTPITVASQAVAPMKDVNPQPVQTAALSVLPMSYPVNQGLVLQKVAIVPKGLTSSLTDLTPLVSTHFITTPQQINGKVVPLTQYLVKPAVVVVSTASPRPS